MSGVCRQSEFLLLSFNAVPYKMDGYREDVGADQVNLSDDSVTHQNTESLPQRLARTIGVELL